MSRIEELATAYKNHIAAPWQTNLAGAQKAIFVVYPKEEDRRLRVRLDLFETATTAAKHKWRMVDVNDIFSRWMVSISYCEQYFEEPADLSIKLRTEFVRHVADELRKHLTEASVDETTVVAVYGVATLYGFARISLILKEIERDIKGRLVLFFPGQYENGNYRLLDARDGWNYLAVPITLHNGGS